MIKNNEIILMIKESIKAIAPRATIILYGSYARGDSNSDSDIDILILLDKKNVTRDDEIKIKYPLYDIEFDTGQIISPLVISKKKWNTLHRITPFYYNVTKEGVVL